MKNWKYNNFFINLIGVFIVLCYLVFVLFAKTLSAPIISGIRVGLYTGYLLLGATFLLYFFLSCPRTRQYQLWPFDLLGVLSIYVGGDQLSRILFGFESLNGKVLVYGLLGLGLALKYFFIQRMGQREEEGAKRALHLMEQGQLDSAWQVTEEIKQINRWSYYVPFIRARILQVQGRFREAIEEYSHAIKLYDHSYFVFLNRAICFSEIFEVESALKDFQTAIEIVPQQPQAYYFRSMIFASLGQYQEAIDDIDRALAQSPHPEYTAQKEKILRMMDG